MIIVKLEFPHISPSFCRSSSPCAAGLMQCFCDALFAGTMSGGGKSVSRGRMGRKIVQDTSSKDIEKMEQSVEADVSKLEVSFNTVSVLRHDGSNAIRSFIAIY